jgi:hypothetical protein
MPPTEEHSLLINQNSNNQTDTRKFQSQVNPENDFGPKLCRLCHGTDGNDFFSPCKCDGSMKYVHRKCLDQWRTVSPNRESFHQCDVCQFNYILKEVPVSTSQGCPPWLTYISLMTLDIGLTLFIWQILVFCLIGLISLFDLKRTRDQIGMFRGWPSFAIDYFSGLTIFFFILGLLGIGFGFVRLFIWCTGMDCCAPKYEMQTYRYSYHYNPMWDVFFFWYWWSIWTPGRVYVPTPINPIAPGPGCCILGPGDCNGIGDCNGCAGGNMGCSGGDCNCNGNGGDAGAVIIVILIVIFVIVVLIGVFIGMFLLFKIVFDIAVRRSAILEKRAMVTRQVVCEIGSQ